ncbi:hypothetical protein JCM8547_007190 [Rhodosporidiobolus lusitaniae]
MPSVKLLAYGLIIGLLSSFYPHLPRYLPSSIASKLPFLPPNSLHSEAGKRWANPFHRYQARAPLHPGHEHSREADWEADIEQQLRFGSKQGGREMEKEYKRQLREVESRAEKAGHENLVKDVLPVYFFEQDADLSSLDAEIEAFQAHTVILLAPHKTSTSHLLVSTASSISSESGPSLTFPSSPKLAQAMLKKLAHHGAHGVAAAGSSLSTLTPSAARALSSLNVDRDTEVVQVLLPVLGKAQGGWDAEKWWDAGKALSEFLHEKEGGSGMRKNDLKYRNVLVIALGSAEPKNASPSFPTLLDSALAHHTSHARELSLLSLYSSFGGAKPQKAIKEGLVGLFTAVAAAGEGEGEQLAGGAGWRFGHLPLR